MQSNISDADESFSPSSSAHVSSMGSRGSMSSPSLGDVFEAGRSPVLGGYSPSRSPSLGGVGDAVESSPSLGGVGDAVESSPSLGGVGDEIESSPSLGGVGDEVESSPSLGGVGDEVESSPSLGIGLIGGAGDASDIADLSSDVSLMSVEMPDIVDIPIPVGPAMDHPQHSWTGRRTPVFEVEYNFSRDVYQARLGACNFQALGCVLERAVFAFTGSPVITLRKGGKTVVMRVSGDTVNNVSTLSMEMFIHPHTGMGELLSDADVNALFRSPGYPPLPRLRCGCIGIPDITDFRMLHFAKVVGGEFLSGMQLWLPPTVIGGDLLKILTYVFNRV